MSKRAHAPASAAAGIEQAIRRLNGRSKRVILFIFLAVRRCASPTRARDSWHLAEDADPTASAIGGGRHRHAHVHAEVPPKVEYHLTEWGESLCPALDKFLTWAEQQPAPTDADRPRLGRS